MSPRVTGKTQSLQLKYSKSLHKPERALKPLVRNVNIFSDRENLRICKRTSIAEYIKQGFLSIHICDTLFSPRTKYFIMGGCTQSAVVLFSSHLQPPFTHQSQQQIHQQKLPHFQMQPAVFEALSGKRFQNKGFESTNPCGTSTSISSAAASFQ